MENHLGLICDKEPTHDLIYVEFFFHDSMILLEDYHRLGQLRLRVVYHPTSSMTSVLHLGKRTRRHYLNSSGLDVIRVALKITERERNLQFVKLV